MRTSNLFVTRHLAAARAQLAALSGRTHQLHSAFVLARNGEIVAEGTPATLAGRDTARATVRYRLPDAVSPPPEFDGPRIRHVWVQ